MINAVPVVATDVGDASWLVGNAGSVVPPGDPRALAEALASLAAAGHAKRARIGELGRARVAEHFSIEAASRRFLECYSSLVSESGLRAEREPASPVSRSRAKGVPSPALVGVENTAIAWGDLSAETPTMLRNPAASGSEHN
jgi:hypothetical protein